MDIEISHANQDNTMSVDTLPPHVTLQQTMYWLYTPGISLS